MGLTFFFAEGYCDRRGSLMPTSAPQLSSAVRCDGQEGTCRVLCEAPTSSSPSVWIILAQGGILYATTGELRCRRI
jgi:hypothetical protein